MSQHLPVRPNLDHLRSQAKTLLADLRAGRLDAAKTFIAHLPAAKNMSPAAVQRAGFRLADAQSAVARKSGFDSWPGLARYIAELRALEGQWTFVTLEVDGAAMPAPMLAGSQLLIDGDRFRMESPGAVYDGVFTIDVEADPPRIDIEFVEGPEAGRSSFGIYTLERDQLTLCLGLTGAPRPQGFVTSIGSGHALERLRRASATRPDGVTGGVRTPMPVPAIPPADESAFTVPMTPMLQQLQGEWKPRVLVASGQAMMPDILRFGSRTMRGNETKVIFGGQTVIHAKVRIDETQTPMAVDYLNIGHGPRVVSFGIIEQEGEVVRVCMAAAGAARPEAFASEPGSGHTLSEWTRK